MIDATDFFLVPGLIDAHAHLEMMMMAPSLATELILPTGTTSMIIDCHDLANVIGTNSALNYFINGFKNMPMRTYYMIPICIPSVSGIETSGYSINYNDFVRSLRKNRVIGVGELMDVKGILEERLELKKILKLAKGKNLLIDGHCPQLRGKRLKEYTSKSGVSTDHEFNSIDEAVEKLEQGLKLIFRRGITKEPSSYFIYKSAKPSNLMLSIDGCTTPISIIEEGYMNYAIRQLIKEGIPAIAAIKMATINIANHYGLKNIGSIREGNYADILFVPNLTEFSVKRVMFEGKLIEELKFPRSKNNLRNTIKREAIKLEELVIKSKNTKENIRTIKINKDSLITEEEINRLRVSNNTIKADVYKDILYLSIINRYETNGSLGNCFVKGFGLKSGAIACSNAQDSQNLIAIGTNHKDMELAINQIIKSQGGCVYIENKKEIAYIQLPIAGIMSDNKNLLAELYNMENNLRDRNCYINNPLFWISSMLTILSIPHLKISDKGLYDTDKHSFVPLIV